MPKIDKIVFATHNHGKANEVAKLLADLGVTVITAKEAGITEDVIEDGMTFEENARKKVEFVGQATGEWTVADDTGICIEALNGAPGIHSARWAGENARGEERANPLLSKLQAFPEPHLRKARFETVAVLRSPEGRCWTFHGTVYGTVALEPRGIARSQLPYDSVFIPDGGTRTFSEMSSEQKNAISHRGIAFRKLKDFIQAMLT